jgi:predicted transcriptional regulator
VGYLAKYRHRLDILADVVKVADTGARKTRIMYFANLSFLLLNKYLEDALHVGFLQTHGDVFFVTKKGKAFLERYRKFSSQYSSVKADLAELEGEAEALERMCRRRRGGGGGKCARRKSFAVLG